MGLSENQLLNDINRTYREIAEIYHKISLKLGLSDSVFIIFYAIAELGDGCCQKDISAYYSISRQTINSSVKNLVKEGFIETKTQKDNTVQLFLTKKGQKLAKEKIYPIIDMENNVFLKLTKDEQKEMVRLIKKYSDLLKEEVKNL